MEGDDPGTLAIAATAASAAVSATSSVAGGLQAQKAGLQAARQANLEAGAAQTQAAAEQNVTTTEAARTLGTAAARAGAMGVTAESASPILHEDLIQAKIKAAHERFTGNLAAREDIYAGKLAQYQGQQAKWAGFIGAGQSVLGAVSNIAKIKMSQGWGSGVPPPPPGP